ncbi:MAG: glutaredoxin domain-containing protein [Microbacteriaceae bacterium]
MSTADYVDGIEVLWRPGCPFCTNLRRGLRRRAIATTEVDIWTNRDAADRVRAVTGGDETVPTVFVGKLALVNPGVGDVVAAIESEFPERVRELCPPDQPGRRRHGWLGHGWLRHRWLRMFSTLPVGGSGH